MEPPPSPPPPPPDGPLRPDPITTARLQLLPCAPHLLDLLIAGPETFTAATGLGVAPGYLEFPEALEFSRVQMQTASPAEAGWWAPWLFVHLADREVIGLGGFRGPPHPETGLVELGYGIAPARRGQGYASEAARGLRDTGLRCPAIRALVAHTLPELNASARALLRAGFLLVSEFDDPNDGRIWRWESQPLPDPAPAPLPTLESPRLRLRPYTPADLPDFVRLNADPEARRHLDGPLDEFMATKHGVRLVGPAGPSPDRAWAVTRRDTGEYVGHAFLHSPRDGSPPEFGVLLFPTHWHQGLGAEIATTVAAFAHGPAGIAEVVAHVDADHTASIAMLDRAGFFRIREVRGPAGTYRVYRSQRPSGRAS